MGEDSQSPGPLAGLKVLDVATLFAGPMIATLLGDYGADVIKVEHPRGGDGQRHMGWQKNGECLWWTFLGRNKRSVTLDLHAPAGQQLLRELASSSSAPATGPRSPPRATCTVPPTAGGWPSRRAPSPSPNGC